MFRCLSKKAKTPVKLRNLSLFQCQGTTEVFCDYLSIRELAEFKKLGEFKEEELVQTETQRLTRKLLDCVKQADIKSMEKIMQPDVDNRWRLMFYPIDHTLADGKEEIISPLKYAAKIFDTYSRNQLWTYVPDINKPLFLEHVRAQKDHIDLNPLFRAYTHYIGLYQNWLNNRKVSSKQLDAYWNSQLGQRIRELIHYARHFIKEMCRNNGKWSNDPNFDVNLVPAPIFCDVYDTRLVQYISLHDLDISRSLMRGTSRSHALADTTGNGSEVVYDLAAFRRLLEVRTDDLTKQVSSHLPSMRGPQKN